MADHIKISQADGTWVLRAGGAVVGETSKALELREGDYPAVIYFPRADIAMALFEKSETKYHCPHKGDSTYYSIQTKSVLIDDAGWSYETPIEAVAEIAGYLAFDGDKVVVEQV